MKSKALKVGRAATGVGKKFGQLITRGRLQNAWLEIYICNLACNIGQAESVQIELEIKSEENI